jgi:hypothetical protein
MTVTINTSELFFDIKNKSHHEVASIENVDQRYVAEAGTENTHEILRCIIEAEARVRLMCGRFLVKVTENNDHNSDLPDTVPGSYTYQFVANARRQDNRGKVIADGMHSAIVSLALSKFYVSVNQMNLAKTHDALATNGVQLLEKMLYEKLPPVSPTF